MDDKYKEMMDSLRAKEPSSFQMDKWKRAVRQLDDQPRLAPNVPSRPKYWVQMAAAVFFGVLIGGLIFGDFSPKKQNQEIAYEDATIEVVYTKL